MKIQSDFFDDDDSELNQLRQQWMKTIEGKGGICPCCGQRGKIYRYKITQHYALCLRWIQVNGDEEGWVNVQKVGPRWMLKSKTHTQLAHWKLVEPQSKRSGVWRVTALGHQFISGEVEVPAAIYVFNNTIYGVDQTQTSYRSCFGVHFDFDELMSTRFDWSKVNYEPRRKK